jgi:pimeloyl-ACP methyl ester carboxylesterase
MRSAVALLALSVLVAAGCAAPGTTGDPDAGEAVPRPRPAGVFYRPPVPLPPGPPGSLIRSEPVAAPAGVRGLRILYHSRDVAGADIAVSGTVFVPDTPAPREGRRVVAWAHGTTGSGDSCAPSTDSHPLEGIEDGASLLAAGDAVVATDYEGLGTPGPHPYLVGPSEAHSVLDAVRAAARLPGTGIGRSFVVFGHSQGGHAALFTGELATTYAPELRLLGVAAASPPTDLVTLARRLSGLDYGVAYLIELAAGYSATDRTARLRPIMTRSGAVYLHLVEDGCNDALVTAYTGRTVRDTFTRDPRITPPWSTGLAHASTGPLPTGLPILILQGAHDPIVPADVTAAAVRRMCQGGDTVDYQVYPDAAHNVVTSAAGPLNAWIADRFHHDATPHTCG